MKKVGAIADEVLASPAHRETTTFTRWQVGEMLVEALGSRDAEHAAAEVSLRAKVGVFLMDIYWDETGDGTPVAMFSGDQINALCAARDASSSAVEQRFVERRFIEACAEAGKHALDDSNVGEDRPREEPRCAHVYGKGDVCERTAREHALERRTVEHQFTPPKATGTETETELEKQLRAHLTIVEYFARKCVEGAVTPLEALQAICETARPFINPITDDKVLVLSKKEPKQEPAAPTDASMIGRIKREVVAHFALRQRALEGAGRH